MSRNGDICRMPVAKSFRQMFKIRAYSEGKSMLELSREEARKMNEQYGGRLQNVRPLFFK